MDPFTQSSDLDTSVAKLLERTRQRREQLTQKMAESPRAAPRKRRTPLAEDLTDNIVQEENIDDDSPNKRQCVREAEREMKADTPAVQGVKSRMQKLVQEQNKWKDENGGENMEVEQPVAKPRDPDPASPPQPTPTARKNRLAALAQSINNWEDDLTHHEFRPKEEKPKRVWQPPPKPVETKPASPKKYPAPQKPIETKTASPKKYPAPKAPSPQESTTTITTKSKPVETTERTETIETTTTKITVTRNGGSMNIKVSGENGDFEVAPSKPPRTYEAEIPVVVSRQSQSTTSVQKSTEPTSSQSSYVSKLTLNVGKKEACNKPVEVQIGIDGKKRIAPALRKGGIREDEPTAKPVNQRMANWEKITSQEDGKRPSAQSAPYKAPEPKKAPFSRPPVPKSTTNASTKTAPANSNPGRPPLPRGVAPGGAPVNARPRAPESNEPDPTDRSVMSRMGMWEDRVRSTAQNAPPRPNQPSTAPMTRPALKLPPGSVPKVPAAPVTPAAAVGSSPAKSKDSPVKSKVPGVKSPALSPTKASAHMRAMQEKLIQNMNKGWKDNEITAKVLAEREAEMKQLENRWKDGIPLENENETKKAEPVVVPLKQEQASAQPVPATRKPSGSGSSGSSSSSSETESKGPDFEGKLNAMGFEVQSTADLQGNKSKVATLTLAQQQQQAKMAEAKPQPKITVTEESYQRTTVKNQKTAHDSFDDSEDGSDESFEATMSKYSAVADPNYNRGQAQTSRQATRQASTASMASSQSATSETSSQYSERRDRGERSSADDEYDSQSDYDDEDEEGEEGIDDLLDEAMDESEDSMQDEKGAPQRRPPNGKTERLMSPKVASCESLVSSDGEKPLVHTVSFYRSTRYSKNGPAPKMTIVRHTSHSRSTEEEEEEEDLPYMPERSIKQKIQELQDLVSQEQNVIMQTSNALNQCCGGGSSFAGSTEAVECNRLLLMACKRREAYLEEIHRLKNRHAKPDQNKGKGSLTISDIRLPLKKDFVSKIGSKDDTAVHYFLIVLRNGPHVIVTQMVSTHDPMVRGSLDFPNLIKLNDVKSGFRYNLEVYGMTVRRDVHIPAKDTPKKKGFTPKKLLGFKGKGHSSLHSPGGPTAVRSTAFQQIALLPITMDSLHQSSFGLEKVPFLCPLQGTIHLKLRCIMESRIEEHGFLTMFEDVSGFGAWHRRWCVLKDNKLKYWKYPDDEKIKEPIGSIDLKRVITDVVGLVTRDVCARPNTFQLLMVKDPRENTQTLTTKYYNTIATDSHLLSADTKEDRLVWCNKLNEALTNLRTWHADALKPIKKKTSNI
ncbi:anillin isoform X2 [Lingula anatina]|uniref:Anillin isoform X2 n=1 Tax=Lingula anatina TaxID=7574 RepID=A0A1S3JE97_LINAN|nr:anillin isoform X2 [Lingula anatina]|eukprot:XP_013408740.1 anillin isoform X2 [Lingula anatina]